MITLSRTFFLDVIVSQLWGKQHRFQQLIRIKRKWKQKLHRFISMTWTQSVTDYIHIKHHSHILIYSTVRYKSLFVFTTDQTHDSARTLKLVMCTVTTKVTRIKLTNAMRLMPIAHWLPFLRCRSLQTSVFNQYRPICWGTALYAGQEIANVENGSLLKSPGIESKMMMLLVKLVQHHWQVSGHGM